MSDVYLHERVFRYLCNRILTGELKAGDALVPSRFLAAEFGVSRNTVLAALSRLEAEGYIFSRRGSGCYVAPGLNIGRGHNEQDTDSFTAPAPGGFPPYRSDIVDFRSGLPDLGSFPVRIWGRLYREVMDEVKPVDLAYNHPEGRPELRNEIAGYVRAFRGVRCSPDQILVTSGTTQAIGIAGRVLLARQDRKTAFFEEPVTADIRHILLSCGADCQSFNVDGEGLCVHELPANASPVLMYVTPSHQFPLGYTMPVHRRLELIAYAKKAGAFIIEDDYDSEFRFGAYPVSSIQGLFPEGVIYIGTFSKTICPAIRTAFLVLPPVLVEKSRSQKWLTDLHNAVIDQLVLAKFIKNGHFRRHLAKMSKIYEHRRKILEDELVSEFGARVMIPGSRAGIHLCASFEGVIFSSALLAYLENEGVKIYPVTTHCTAEGRYADTVILGYGMLPEERIVSGVRLLSSLLQKIP